MRDKLKEIESPVRRSAFSIPLCLSERGATLVELMFGLTIAMVAMGAGYTVMNSSQKRMGRESSILKRGWTFVFPKILWKTSAYSKSGLRSNTMK